MLNNMWLRYERCKHTNKKRLFRALHSRLPPWRKGAGLDDRMNMSLSTFDRSLLRQTLIVTPTSKYHSDLGKDAGPESTKLKTWDGVMYFDKMSTSYDSQSTDGLGDGSRWFFEAKALSFSWPKMAHSTVHVERLSDHSILELTVLIYWLRTGNSKHFRPSPSYVV